MVIDKKEIVKRIASKNISRLKTEYKKIVYYTMQILHKRITLHFLNNCKDFSIIDDTSKNCDFVFKTN